MIEMKRKNKRQSIIKTKQELPQIPEKRYFTIGEVEKLCAVKAHVLRYWEQEFKGLQSVARRGNRRYYQHHNILFIRQIKKLLYEDGFTIEGARSQLEGALGTIRQSISTQTILKKVIIELEDILKHLEART